MSARYEDSSTHWFWNELRTEAQPLPADLEQSDHLITASLIRKRQFRKLTWTLLDEIWTRIAQRRKTMPETGGILFEGGVEVTQEAFLQGFGTGRFGFCVRIAAAMCHTMRLVSAELRAEAAWTEMFKEVDTEIEEMTWMLRIMFFERHQPEDAEKAKALRAQGKSIKEILRVNTSFEGFVIDEVESPFRIYSGLAFNLLRQTAKLDPEYVANVLRNSAPMMRDWANQSMAAFEETRKLQAFATQTTVAQYSDIALSASECYQIVLEDTPEARFEFNDGFIATNLQHLKAMIREHSPHRIGCGGLRKTAVAEHLDFVTDSLYWFVEILHAHGSGIHELEVDY